MKLTIEPTDQFVLTNSGMQCRLWMGSTEQGVPCRVLVFRVLVREGHDSSEFDRALQSTPPVPGVSEQLQDGPA